MFVYFGGKKSETIRVGEGGLESEAGLRMAPTITFFRLNRLKTLQRRISIRR